MIMKKLLKSAAIGAGLCILLAGLALAQTAPTPAPAPAAPQAAPPAASSPAAPQSREDRRARMQAITEQCRSEVGNVRGPDRREAMRKCVEDKRAAAGPNARPQRDAARNDGKRDERRAHAKACRDELKDQRFTEAERRAAMQGCIAKRDPQLGKQLACRNEAEAKKLEPRSRELRQFMRECRQRA
jgi:hypothetical protein